MTKSELKSIIMECLEEEGVLAEAFDEDQAVLENCEFIEEACFVMLDEAMDHGTRYQTMEDAIAVWGDPKEAVNDLRKGKKALAKSIKEENKNADPAKMKSAALKKVAAKLGNKFKVAGDKIVCVYSGKEGHVKQGFAIAGAATALAASIGAIAYAMSKKDSGNGGDKEDKED